jgi:phosphatidate cytidylyltransferase
MGALLIGLVVGVLMLDQRFAPWFPCLLSLLLVLSWASTWELLQLLPPEIKPFPRLCYLAVTALVLANWAPLLASLIAPVETAAASPWQAIGFVYGAIVLAAFLSEMAHFRVPGHSLQRIALTLFIAAYIGFLSYFFAQLRWAGGGTTSRDKAAVETLSLALAIFVPKMCDTGAYFTGRLLGRHPMAPVLSPKKTWEGAAGGLTAAVLTTAAINAFGPVLTGGLLSVIAFGLTVGAAGMLGDLAESLIKRDCRRKDASQAMPGFGGVLDVVDAILFAAPVAYWWLRLA